MGGGIEMGDMDRNARVRHICIEETAPASAATEKHHGVMTMLPIRILAVKAVLLVDGAGSGNTVTMDVLDDGVTVLTTAPTFVTADAVDTINSEAVVDPDVRDIAAGSLVQVSLESAGTITAGHLVGVDIQYMLLGPED